MKFKFTVTRDQIDQAYKRALASAAKTAQIKGFRKGKAPANLVEKHVGQSKLQENAIELVLPEIYSQEIKAKKLKPITYPQIKPVSVEANSDWVFEAEVIEAPEIKLGDYQKALKGAAAKTKIWTPDQGPEPKKDEQNEDQDAQLKLIFDTLLETSELEVPELLVKREVDRMLSKLLQQVNTLGLDIDAYLQSINQTKDQLTDQYRQTAITSLKLEFILQALAKDLKIEISSDQVKEFVNQIPDEKLKQQVADNPQELANIQLVLTKQETINRLKQFLS